MIILLVIVSVLLVGCKIPKSKMIVLEEEGGECVTIDLSEYDKELEALQNQTKMLRKEIGILTNELYKTNEELKETQSISIELEAFKNETEKEINKLSARDSILSDRIAKLSE